ncbi:hypothetical protein D0Y65_026926 [Glycine soja]|uniref:Protein NDR1 n=1 Tax=Glycine soja TaxID=3848 RepID=A0A445ILR4_GLYSO|nr:hypothetical protein D0Y65_026926 [Glycine soja]
MWQTLLVKQPRLYIDYIYVPALNKSLHSALNNTVFFTLKLVNRNMGWGVQYDNVNLSSEAFVGPDSTRPLGNATLEGFYQGRWREGLKHGSFLASATTGKLTTVLSFWRVDFATAVKYKKGKYRVWYTRDRLQGGANLEIDDSQLMVNWKPVRLGDSPVAIIASGSRKHCELSNSAHCVLGLSLSLVVILFQELSMMCGLTEILVLNVRSVFCTLFREVEDAGSS